MKALKKNRSPNSLLVIEITVIAVVLASAAFVVWLVWYAGWPVLVALAFGYFIERIMNWTSHLGLDEQPTRPQWAAFTTWFYELIQWRPYRLWNFLRGLWAPRPQYSASLVADHSDAWLDEEEDFDPIPREAPGTYPETVDLEALQIENQELHEQLRSFARIEEANRAATEAEARFAAVEPTPQGVTETATYEQESFPKRDNREVAFRDVQVKSWVGKGQHADDPYLHVGVSFMLDEDDVRAVIVNADVDEPPEGQALLELVKDEMVSHGIRSTRYFVDE